jgi:hypothetical protein
MSPRLRIFVSQRAREQAVDQAYAAFLDAHQLRPLDRREPNGSHSLFSAALPPLVRIAKLPGRPGDGESTQRPEPHGLLLFEQLILVYLAVLIALIVAGNLWQHVG